MLRRLSQRSHRLHQRNRRRGQKDGSREIGNHRPRVVRPPKGNEVKWVDKTKAIHQAGLLIGEKLSYLAQGFERNQEVLAMSEDVREDVEDARQERRRLKEDIEVMVWNF